MEEKDIKDTVNSADTAEETREPAVAEEETGETTDTAEEVGETIDTTEEAGEGDEEEDDFSLSPFDTMMIRLTELDTIVRGMGYEGAIQMRSRESAPRYSLRRKEYPDNEQEISFLFRDMDEPGCGLLVMVTRIPFGEHTADEIYDILVDSVQDAGSTAFNVFEEDELVLLKSSMAIGSEALRESQIRRLLELHHADEKTIMERM